MTEPHIEDAALRNDIPIQLDLYGELGLDRFSIQDFPNRGPFSNPEQFERLFVRLNVKGWIEPEANATSRVTLKAREAARSFIQAGDVQLSGLASVPDHDLKRLVSLLKQIVQECCLAPEPPERWAILKRFRVADERYPPIMQVRKYVLDLFAYRGDSHLSAPHPRFNEAGIVWIVLGSRWDGSASNAGQMAKKMAFRGYEIEDHDIAIQAALELGWVREGERPDTFRLTQERKRLREQAEDLTHQYFYAPWSVLMPVEIAELYELLVKLREGLSFHRKPA